MTTEVAFLPLHHQRAAELRARAEAYRLARSAASPKPRRMRWPWLARREPAGLPAEAVLR
jgi:hypothetical protein